jgi:hypothetical protein
VSVGIDELAHEVACERRSCHRNDEQPGHILEVAAADGLDAHRGAVELDLHLTAAGEADPISQGAWNDQASGLVDGSPHGIDDTTCLGIDWAVSSGSVRPTGVGRAISTFDIPIEGRDEWLAAARRLA